MRAKETFTDTFRRLGHVHTWSRDAHTTPPAFVMWLYSLHVSVCHMHSPKLTHYLSFTPECIWGKDMWILDRKWDSLRIGNFMWLAYRTGKRGVPSRGWGRGRTAGRKKERQTDMWMFLDPDRDSVKNINNHCSVDLSFSSFCEWCL